MNKNMRIWIIGISIALVIIIVAAAAAMNRNSGSQEPAGTTSESGVTNDPNASSSSMSGADSGAMGSSQGTSMADSHMDHSSHGGQGAAGGDNLSRYLTEQDSIMMNMMDDMMIREKSGSADIDFLKGMIPHHEAAIKMSESYLDYGGDIHDLETLAQDIITAQKKELEEMNGLIKKYEDEGGKNQENEDAYLEKYSEMFSDDSMSHHINPSDVRSIDQAFAEGMIMHHQMAVDMAKDILDYSEKDEVKKLAQEIIDVQEKEIEQMKKLIQE